MFGTSDFARQSSIRALEELGLSLEQIGRLIEKDMSPAELRSVLALKQAQLERSLQEEKARIRHIESRIAQIDREGETDGFDVITKSVAATPFLSVNCVCDSMDEVEVARLVRTVAEEGVRQIEPALRDKLVVVAGSDIDSEMLDIDIGFSLTRPLNTSVRIAGDIVLRASELPAVETMATIARRPGTSAQSHASLSAVGRWIEANSYEVAGPCREVFLEPIAGPPGFEGALVEIQVPVRKAPPSASDFQLHHDPDRATRSGHTVVAPILAGINRRRHR